MKFRYDNFFFLNILNLVFEPIYFCYFIFIYFLHEISSQRLILIFLIFLGAEEQQGEEKQTHK